ncbi:MAG TPA: porin family protein, partial [Sulfurovum sp.]|nr:porin family protein [Sulfurovum sp.]
MVKDCQIYLILYILACYFVILCKTKGTKMKSAITRVALSSLLLGSILMAGKNVVPVDTPVAPVAYINPLPIYVGLGLLWSGTSRDCACQDESRLKDTTYGGIIRVGYDFNPYIGIEARALKSSMDSDFAETTHYGIFLKPQYHITDALNVYGLIGYGKTKVDCVAPEHGIDRGLVDVNGLSLGIGLEYDISSDEAEGAYARGFDGKGDQEKGLGVWVDYQNLLHDEG